ncbi:hypothetical protein MVEN_00427000 [Mycena venus]|uniref:Uncharacterized protein n=1 Tax=Mycena venus TaxID=2733690 RepID=A0A8H6YQT0_9AGAR|nr:hypothetical protein MVEN_00427000 [Mycena venus]
MNPTMSNSNWLHSLMKRKHDFRGQILPKDEFDGVPPPPLEILPLIVSGPSSNRVDLIFFADGYLQEERDKFFEDATRLADDISGNQTFNTVKPLLNFWAAFTPSKESGVGVGGKPKDTAFGLYRDGTELKRRVLRQTQSGWSSVFLPCPLMVLRGNDPLYGGLGGRFTVITPSIANVGEEYDGGYAYFGPNAHANLSEALPWAQWLTDPKNVRVERSVMPMQDYAWTLLNTSAPWSVTFVSSGTFCTPSRALLRIGGSPRRRICAWSSTGRDLEWAPRAGIGMDSFTLLNGEREPEAQMCNAEILEFGDESEFVSTPGHYSLYPTYSLKNQTTYRPTNEDCLMRQVTTPNFCKACIEGLWLALLRDVDLIDDIEASCLSSPPPSTTLALHLVPLAQFRAATVQSLEESYTITWTNLTDGQVLEELANKTEVQVGKGRYGIEVLYRTNEVRVDREGRLGGQEGGLVWVAVRRCSKTGEDVIELRPIYNGVQYTYSGAFQNV